jgi:hypothetical protein
LFGTWKPSTTAAARTLDLGNATDAEVRQALGTTFPKHPLHKIVCIGALIANRQPEGWRVDALGAPHIGERSEAKLISDFIEKIGQLLPQLKPSTATGSICQCLDIARW